MRLVRVIQNGLYAVVEDTVTECVGKDGKIELYETFLKTWLVELKDVPKELLQ